MRGVKTINCLLVLLVSINSSKSQLSGHLKPLGSHKPPTISTVELREVPQPREFYERFVINRKPVVLRGAAGHSGAYTRWTVDNLIKEYGDLVVRLEAREEQDSEVVTTDIGFGRSTIGQFVSNYQTWNAYIISQVPSPMEKDISIPPCLRCGSFAKTIQEVHLFIVGRGGKTLLHRDPYSNIHCVFNGTKDWILIGDDQELEKQLVEKKMPLLLLGNVAPSPCEAVPMVQRLPTNERDKEKYLYQDSESRNEFGGFSVIDVDEVDLLKFPKVAEIEYSKVVLNKGDCIFMPGGFWHQVRVNGEYNTAVSIWFTRTFKSLEQDWSDCEGKVFTFTPMSEVDVIWRFSGGNTTLTQGHMDITVMRYLLLSSAKNNKISFIEFCENYLGHREDCHVTVEKAYLMTWHNPLVMIFSKESFLAAVISRSGVDSLAQFFELIFPRTEDFLNYAHNIDLSTNKPSL